MTPEQEIRQNAADLIKAHGNEIYWAEHDAMRGQPCDSLNLRKLVSQLLALLNDRKRPSMTLECLRIAAGFSHASYQSLGNTFGVTKEAIRLRIHAFTEALGLPPTGNIQTDQEKRVYSSNGKRPMPTDVTLSFLDPGMTNQQWRIASGLKEQNFLHHRRALEFEGRVKVRNKRYYPSPCPQGVKESFTTRYSEGR
ncbi:MAG TPA: hypothetical protein VL357_01735 [Rariglobus sp.]|nr:hypothetical protein [Rariglobus sp.]